MEPPETSLEEQLHRLATFFRATEPLAWRSVIRERAETRPREITSAPMLRERPPSRMDLPAFISRTVRAQINSAASKAARAISFRGTQVTVSSWPIPEQMEIPFSAILSARTPTPPPHYPMPPPQSISPMERTIIPLAEPQPARATSFPEIQMKV